MVDVWLPVKKLIAHTSEEGHNAQDVAASSSCSEYIAFVHHSFQEKAGCVTSRGVTLFLEKLNHLGRRI